MKAYIESIVQVEIKVAVEMSANEFVDLLLAKKISGNGIDTALGRYLRSRVQVLELVHRLEFLDIQAIGNDTIRFPLE